MLHYHLYLGDDEIPDTLFDGLCSICSILEALHHQCTTGDFPQPEDRSLGKLWQGLEQS